MIAYYNFTFPQTNDNTLQKWFFSPFKLFPCSKILREKRLEDNIQMKCLQQHKFLEGLPGNVICWKGILF